MPGFWLACARWSLPVRHCASPHGLPCWSCCLCKPRGRAAAGSRTDARPGLRLALVLGLQQVQCWIRESNQPAISGRAATSKAQAYTQAYKVPAAAGTAGAGADATQAFEPRAGSRMAQGFHCSASARDTPRDTPCLLLAVLEGCCWDCWSYSGCAAGALL